MDYKNVIAILSGVSSEEKIISTLEETENLLIQEFIKNENKQITKDPEALIFNDIAAAESLTCSLLHQLQVCKNAKENILQVLSTLCRFLQRKLTPLTLNRVVHVCSELAKKAIAEKNWIVLLKCFSVLKSFDAKVWILVFSNRQRKLESLKIIHQSIDVGKEEVTEKNKQIVSAIKVACVDVLKSIITILLGHKDENVKLNEWFIMLFPLLFDENLELRKVTLSTCEIIRNHSSFQEWDSWPNLKELIKMCCKSLKQCALNNQSDWVSIWCFLLNLLGNEFPAKKNTEIINQLLQVEEAAFRSNNMATRYNAYVAWKFLVNKFLETSMDEVSRRLKLILQPLVSNNAKTLDICLIKFEVWWHLIRGIEPCLEKHASNVFYHFLNFCFGPVSDPAALNNIRTNSNLPNSTNYRRIVGTLSPLNYPLVTLRRMKGLDFNRTDALAQILNLDPKNKSFKLPRFENIVLSQPRIFLTLSKMIIFCVWECSVIIVDSKELISEDKKFYLKEIWRSLILHIRSVDKMPHSESEESFENGDRHEKIEMMKNLFRVLIRLSELSVANQNLASVYLNPILDSVLSAEHGISNDVLKSRLYYIGTEDLLMGTPLLIMLDIFLSPVFLNNHNQCHQNDEFYMLLLNRILCLGIDPKDTTIPFTQAVMKRLDSAANNSSYDGNLLKSLWVMTAKTLTQYVGQGRDINQGTESDPDFKCIFSVLLFPVTYSKTFASDQEVIVKVWAQLFLALQKNAHTSNFLYEGNEICNLFCAKFLQEMMNKKSLSPLEMLHLINLISSAVKMIQFSSINKILSKHKFSGQVAAMKYYTIHLFYCIQLLQNYSLEMQKLDSKSDLFFKIIIEFAKCALIICEDLQDCYIQSILTFMIKQFHFLLSVQGIGTPLSSMFYETLSKLWDAFLNVYSKPYILSSKKKKFEFLSMFQPLKDASLMHSDHKLHVITIKFCKTEKISLGVNIAICPLCKELNFNELASPNAKVSLTNDEGRSPNEKQTASPEKKSPLQSGFERKISLFKGRELPRILKNSLTKHQKEVLSRRRDDIPALYQDLTQDSQPSLIDISQDNSQNDVPIETEGKERQINSGEDVSFLCALKHLKSPNAQGNKSLENGQNKVEKSEESHVFESTLVEKSNVMANSVLLSADIREIPQDNTVGKDGTHSPFPTKTVLVIKRTPNSNLNNLSSAFTDSVSPSSVEVKNVENNLSNISASTNSVLCPSVKVRNVENLSEEQRGGLPAKQSESKYKSKLLSLSDSKEMPIKMFISKLKTGNPEVKQILTLGNNLQLEEPQVQDLKLTERLDKRSGSGECASPSNEENSKEGNYSNSVPDSPKQLKKLGKESKEAAHSRARDVTMKDANNKDDKNIENGDEFSCKKVKGNNVNTLTSGSMQVSPARVLMKKLDSKEAGGSICRALLFDDVSPLKEEQTGMKCYSNKVRKSSLISAKVQSTLGAVRTSENSPKHIQLDIRQSFENCAKKLTQCTPEKKNDLISENTDNSTKMAMSSSKKGVSSSESQVKNDAPENNEKISKKVMNVTIPSVLVDPPMNLVETSAQKGKLPENFNCQLLNSSEAPKNIPVSTDSSPYETSQPHIMCDKDEYVRLLSLMPHTNSAANELKIHRISTRSDWARRFGNGSKLDLEVTKKIDKDADKTSVSCHSIDGTITGEHFLTKGECTDLLDSPDFIESSQDNKESPRDSMQKACFVKVPKLVLTPGSVVNDTEGGLVIKEKLSPVSYRVSNKNHSRLEDFDAILSNNPALNDENLVKENLECISNKTFKDRIIGGVSRNLNEQLSDAAFPNLCSKETISSNKDQLCVRNETLPCGVSEVSSSATSHDSCSTSCNRIPEMTEEIISETNNQIFVNASSEVFPTQSEVTESVMVKVGNCLESPSSTSHNSDVQNQPANTSESDGNDPTTKSDSHSSTLKLNERDNTEQVSHLLSSPEISNQKLQSVDKCNGNVSPSKSDIHSSPSKIKERINTELESHLLSKPKISNQKVQSMDKSTENISPPKSDRHSSPSKLHERDSTDQESHLSSQPKMSNKSDQSVDKSTGNISPPKSDRHSSPSKLHERDSTDQESHLSSQPKMSNKSDQSVDKSTGNISPPKSDRHSSPSKLHERDSTEQESHLSSQPKISNQKVQSVDKSTGNISSSKSDTHLTSSKVNEKNNTGKLSHLLSSPKISNQKAQSKAQLKDGEVAPEIAPEVADVSVQEMDNPSTNGPTANASMSTSKAGVEPEPMETPRSERPKRKLPTASEVLAKRGCGRAAQLVGLALTKNQIKDLCSPVKKDSTDAPEDTEDTDVVYRHSLDGQEKCSWIRHVPCSESSPVRTNLKRKLPSCDDDSISPPSKKCVRFADPLITEELHFSKKANVENTDPADTYRIVRTKRGKVYVQKNNPNKRGRPRGSKKFASSSGMVPMWPSLKDCKRPVSEVVQYLSDGPEGVSAVTAALAERAIETVGDLCSLSTSEVAGLPIKQPQETTVKWAMQKFEDKLKSVQDPDSIGQLSESTPEESDADSIKEFFRTHVSQMSPESVYEMLQQNLSPSVFENLLNLKPSTSQLPHVEVNHEEKSSLTDELSISCQIQCIFEEYKKKCEEDSSCSVTSDASAVQNLVQLLQCLCENCATEGEDSAMQVKYVGAARIMCKFLKCLESDVEESRTFENCLVEFLMEKVSSEPIETLSASINMKRLMDVVSKLMEKLVEKVK